MQAYNDFESVSDTEEWAKPTYVQPLNYLPVRSFGSGADMIRRPQKRTIHDTVQR
ncbi:hypothetical protein OG948_57290 (plasmid) [Embleya sp. NBC_00888]|uniref:hypothetical protein n=1 Tax=Embleya sp. NBC_00888 TaxID=2975960 RepID=UPI002F916288|nr:hypothetical protein OG948_57290 [Embleya sp. NBC_00888]